MYRESRKRNNRIKVTPPRKGLFIINQIKKQWRHSESISQSISNCQLVGMWNIGCVTNITTTYALKKTLKVKSILRGGKQERRPYSTSKQSLVFRNQHSPAKNRAIYHSTIRQNEQVRSLRRRSINLARFPICPTACRRRLGR